MKTEALELILRMNDPVDRINVLREYIQVCALRSLHESRAFDGLSFVGGTALRFLYDLPRYSEDLDFSLENTRSYDPLRWMSKLKRDLVRLGFDAQLTWNDRKTLQIAWIRVAGLLKEAGIVAREEQKLSVKLKIDTVPPQGAITETRLVNRHMIFAIRHHDLPSLMSGKIHALLARPFAKGRDWYDLLWYRTRHPPVIPNEELLKAALAQTGTAVELSWMEMVRNRLASLPVETIRADVEPFLEHRLDVELLTKENLARILVD